MEEVRYMITEASKRIDVEAHVLRYWQKELDLPISRNEMEQRYYKEEDIELLKKVKQLKEKGFQLKAIKMLLPSLRNGETVTSNMESKPKEDTVIEILRNERSLEKQDEINMKDGTSVMEQEKVQETEVDSDSKMLQFRAVMNHIISSALKENNELLAENITTNVTEGVTKEMKYLMRLQEEKEEERYHKFDAALRDYQKGRISTAATIDGRKKKSKFFKKNKVYL